MPQLHNLIETTLLIARALKIMQAHVKVLKTMKASLFLVLVAAARAVSSFGLDISSFGSFMSKRSSVKAHSPHSQVRNAVPSIATWVNTRALCASSSFVENEEEEEEESDLRRNELIRKYNTASILFGLVSLILAAMPDRTNTAQLASKVGGAAGYGLAAGTCYILAGATSHDRLGSDTYKRLNVGLFGSSLLSLIAIPGEAAFHPSFGVAVLLLSFMGFVKGYGASVSYNGWRRGVDPESDAGAPRKMIREFLSGVKSTLGGIYNTPRKGFVYLMYFLLVLAGGFSALMQGMFNMGVSSKWCDCSQS
jgi:hypothetical protein